MKEVTILLSDRRLTQIMQHFDVFEPGKVVLCPTIFATVCDDYGDSHIAALKKQCAESGICDPVAVYDRYRVYYRNPEVKSVSDGKKWVTLDQLIGETP